MDLKKSQSSGAFRSGSPLVGSPAQLTMKAQQDNQFDRLNSQDGQVLAIDCQLRAAVVWVGLLCLAGSYRYQINESTTVDLLDRDNNFIATVQLDPTFQGEKNGYLPNVSLKII